MLPSSDVCCSYVHDVTSRCVHDVTSAPHKLGDVSALCLRRHVTLREPHTNWVKSSCGGGSGGKGCAAASSRCAVPILARRRWIWRRRSSQLDAYGSPGFVFFRFWISEASCKTGHVIKTRWKHFSARCFATQSCMHTKIASMT